MRNLHIKNLSEEVPKDIRLEVYKNALWSLISPFKYSKRWEKGLCLLLPCALWDLETYLHVAPDGMYWDYEETSTAFPELSHKVITKIKHSPIGTDVNALRVKYLKKWIKDLKTDEQG